MKWILFCPTRFEIPQRFRAKVDVFGIGSARARKLGKQLSVIPREHNILVFGCAGALHEHLAVGNVYSISRVGAEKTRVLSDFPAASIASSGVVLQTAEEKKQFQASRQVDLVDQEMEFLFESCPPEIRERLFFLRGVIDGPFDQLTFLEGTRVNWRKLWRPKELMRFIRFVLNYRKYLRAMDKALERIIGHQ
jgi:hypothetical protein